VNGPIPQSLRFNFGFLLEAPVGTKRAIDLAYPHLRLEEVTLAPLEGSFSAGRTSSGIYVGGLLHTQIMTECSRCLTEVAIPASLELDDLFYYPPGIAPPGEYIVTDGGFVDLGPLVRELSLLEIPMQVICRPECKGMCPECGADWNETTCACKQETIDPRLAVLKTLLDADDETT
jgi:uncharacterized protein